MTDSITCPNCNELIPLTEAITHGIDKKYKEEIQKLQKQSENERQKLIAYSKKRIEEEKEKTAKELEAKLRLKITQDMELKVKDKENESKELKEQKKELQDQVLELTKSKRKLQDENREKELEMQKAFVAEQEKIREQEQKRLQEEFKLRDLEKDKKLADASRQVEDMKRKLEQGSQQMQGEVLELAIEEMLKAEFPFDEIKEVPKGVTGADIIQVVKNRGGKVCGRIIWETKRTKNWSGQWIGKLKDDQRKIKAEIAVLVSETLPDYVSHFSMVEGVWVCSYPIVKSVAYALRTQLLEVATVKQSQKGQDGKMELLYNYVMSIEFRHRVEAIIEAFSSMQEEIEKERRWFSLKWAREEKNLRKVLDITTGMQGDLQSITGKSLSNIDNISLLEEDKKETDVQKSLL